MVLNYLKVVYNGNKWEKVENFHDLSFFSLRKIFMFIGEYNHNLDEKGRLSVPKKFRPDLSKGAFVTKGFDSCLFLYTPEEWQKQAEKIANSSHAKSNSRAYSRFMLAGAMDVSLDKQGRIMLPEYLRIFAGLKKNVVVTGLYNRLELWDQEKWAEYKKKTESESNEIAEQMSEFGV